jgi:Putative prokaryotic signal transducing protein
MGRVCIGTCLGPADAALVRSAFEAHDLHVFINAEQHASMLGGLGGGLVPLQIYVAEEDAEEAAALLKDLREHTASDAGDDEHEDDEEDDGEAAGAVEQRVASRRRTGVVLLLAMCVTFGTASMYVGSWIRGVTLAVVEILGFKYTIAQPKVGAPIFAACIAADLILSLITVRRARAAIPEARVRR